MVKIKTNFDLAFIMRSYADHCFIHLQMVDTVLVDVKMSFYIECPLQADRVREMKTKKNIKSGTFCTRVGE